MDIDDILYIVIAIVIAVINGIAQKKKKSNQKAASAASPVHTAEAHSVDPDAVDPFEILFGGAVPKTSQEQTSNTFTFEEEEEPVATGTSSNAYQSYSFEEAAKVSVEYEQPFEEVSEEALYKQPEVKPIDIYVEQEPLSEIDIPVSNLDVEEIQLEDISVGAIKGIEEEEAESRERNKNGLLDDFDAEKAIVYSEIMQPKYF